jgi:hypothetical protein
MEENIHNVFWITVLVLLCSHMVSFLLWIMIAHVLLIYPQEKLILSVFVVNVTASMVHFSSLYLCDKSD